MIRLVLELKRPPMTSNDQRRAHWAQVRRAKQEVEMRVRSAAQQARVGALSGPQVVTVVWFAPNARTRDSDSLSPFLKAALDGLVRSGVLIDDSSEYVVDTHMRVEVDRINPRIEILIEEAS